jgi:hypothetical protein
MNTGIFNDYFPKKSVPSWLLPCTCINRRCYYNAHLRLDILCVQRIPYIHSPPANLDPYVIIQFIEFTYCNDRFSLNTIITKTTKYQLLLGSIRNQGWNVAPLMVITASARTTTHTHSLSILHDTLKALKSQENKYLHQHHSHTTCYVHFAIQKASRKQLATTKIPRYTMKIPKTLFMLQSAHKALANTKQQDMAYRVTGKSHQTLVPNQIHNCLNPHTMPLPHIPLPLN